MSLFSPPIQAVELPAEVSVAESDSDSGMGSPEEMQMASEMIGNTVDLQGTVTQQRRLISTLADYLTRPVNVNIQRWAICSVMRNDE